jgi:3-deoxy-D-manno-octulosonate 8-phosphate phosphatase (KDO 8-P phosphatase)
MKEAGLSAAPANAHPSVLEQAGFVAKAPGGHGAVRELADHLLQMEMRSPNPIRK